MFKYLFLAAILSGCVSTTNQKPSVYQSNLAKTQMNIIEATVDSVRSVVIEDQTTGVGTYSGAAIGGIAGSTIGDGAKGLIGSIVGVISGGYVGDKASKQIARKDGVEIIVKKDNGEFLAVIQELDDKTPIRKGDRVKLIGGYGGIRVVK